MNWTIPATKGAAISKASINLLWTLASVVAALAATEFVFHIDRSLEQHGLYGFFLVAVAIAAVRGGFLHALVAIVVSSLVIAWFLPPAHTLKVASTEDIIRLVVFVGIGLIIGYIHYARNRAEKAFQESERRLNYALESSGVACWDVNVPAGTFWRSDNLPAIFGRTDANFATTYEGFFAYIHPEDREFFHLATVSGGPHQRDYDITHRVFCADGSIHRVNTRGRMYLDEQGRVERMVGAVFFANSAVSKVPVEESLAASNAAGAASPG